MKESQKHLDAFELYFKFIQSNKTKSESIIGVSSEYNIATSTVWRWNKLFDWDGRTAIRSKEIQKQVEKRTNRTIVENKASYLSIIHNIFGKYTHDVKNNLREPLEITNMYELERGIKTALLLQEEPTEHFKEESNIQHTTDPLTEIEEEIKKELNKRSKTKEEVFKELF